MATPRAERNTLQRRVVLEELRKLTSHPTAAELYEIARDRLPKISLGTVYRNLDRLARRGVIRKLDLAGSEARFDGNPKHHCHVRCVCCGRVDDVAGVPGDFVKSPVNHPDGYEIKGFRLEFIGTCPACRKHREPGGAGMTPRG
ncbi:MAG: transcriptional repressor [Planctomycetes bacterium]|nr:transcriptional repressor [Planctomycetota bacterium]